MQVEFKIIEIDGKNYLCRVATLQILEIKNGEVDKDEAEYKIKKLQLQNVELEKQIGSLQENRQLIEAIQALQKR
jgi:cell division protein FtsB